MLNFDYIPIKYNWHKNKHTLRFKKNYNSTNYILDCNRILKKDELPITIIDEFFDDSFINCKNTYGYLDTNFQSKPLNKKHNWTLEKILNDETKKIIKKWDPLNGVVCKIYDIPIQKYILKNNNNIKLGWLKWNNKIYDPSYIYIFNGNEDDTEGTLKKYCPLNWIEPKIDNLEMIYKKIFIEKKKKKKLIKTNECYIEIDLLKFVNIKCIATYGKYPNKRVFPKRKSHHNYYYYDTNKPYINIIDNIYNDSYVKKYSVYYKDSITNKWNYYKDFDGNINSYTIKNNLVDIYSRYIRIKPLEYVKTKSMIIYIYGSTIKNQYNYDSDDEEIIKYTLTPPNQNNYRYDGYGEYRCSPEWFYGQYYKNERKKKLKELLNEQLNDL
jgi:hypothetical protein